MIVLQMHHITINHAGRLIFDDLSWSVADRERVGLVGPNGAGKSSLLKAVIGDVIPDSGTIVRAHVERGHMASVGYLPQEVALPQGVKMIDAAMTLPPELADVEAELSRIEAQLATPKVYNDEAALTRALARQEVALVKYERLGGSRHRSRVRELLARLGFTPDDFDLLTDSLSGGQKKLVALVQLAVEMPDILLLDEPDNHLDLDAKRGLEEFIRSYPGAVVIVSHDRYLLDEVATQIAELEDGKLTVYPGNYTAYATERELRRLRQQQQYAAQQKEIARIEESIKRFELWAAIAFSERYRKQARSRRMMLQRMEEHGEIIEGVRERRTMGKALQLDGWRGSTKALELKNLSMAFENAEGVEDWLFMDLNLLVRHGERVGLIGPNGAGKSVLFRLILGEMQPVDGEVKIGPSIRVGYYSQEHQTLDGWLHRTPIERVRDLVPIGEGEAVSFLGGFLFSYDHARQPIGTLSGGERSRLQLATLVLQKPNLLLLDEPTNNLDIPSVEVLESVIDDFEGAVFTISHDRYFLDRVVDRVVELDNGSLCAYDGGYTDYLAKKK